MRSVELAFRGTRALKQVALSARLRLGHSTMMSYLSSRARITFATVAAGLRVALGYAALASRSQPPIRIAFHAVKLYIDEVNRNGGVDGYSIELVSVAQPQTANANR